jgi:hypothetical protein
MKQALHHQRSTNLPTKKTDPQKEKRKHVTSPKEQQHHSLTKNLKKQKQTNPPPKPQKQKQTNQPTEKHPKFYFIFFLLKLHIIVHTLRSSKKKPIN